MATKTISLSGKAMWAKLKEGFADTKYRPNYNLSLIPDQASVNRMKEHKLGLEFKDNNDGEKYVNIRRYIDKNPDYKDSEGNLCGKAPRVVFPDGTVYTGIVGNGSEVTVKLDIYDTKYVNKGHRLVAVRVDKLIEYVPADTSGVDETDSLGTDFPPV